MTSEARAAPRTRHAIKGDGGGGETWHNHTVQTPEQETRQGKERKGEDWQSCLWR
jgi:hypothetical protein